MILLNKYFINRIYMDIRYKVYFIEILIHVTLLYNFKYQE